MCSAFVDRVVQSIRNTNCIENVQVPNCLLILVAPEQARPSTTSGPTVTYIQCKTTEDSHYLHSIYKDKVKYTQPPAKKDAQFQAEVETFNTNRRISYDLRNIRKGGEGTTGRKGRRTSILDHMNHGSDDALKVKQKFTQITEEEGDED